ncbi:hypothetical protein HanHA300_Chr10g0367671 [Helianthus annuus]|nr:hypothetical protein HanHA300_Chr10g0367671 [Helianthus annuus]
MRVMLSFSSIRAANNFVKEKKELWFPWFSALEILEDQNFKFERVVRLKITGVPIHLCDKEVFNTIAAQFGRVVHGSRASITDVNLAFEEVGVVVNDGRKIAKSFDVQWRAEKFPVWVTESVSDWSPDFIVEEPGKFIRVDSVPDIQKVINVEDNDLNSLGEQVDLNLINDDKLEEREIAGDNQDGEEVHEASPMVLADADSTGEKPVSKSVADSLEDQQTLFGARAAETLHVNSNVSMGEGFTGASFNEPQTVINQEREKISPVVGSGSGSPSSDSLPSYTPFEPEPLFSGCEERSNSDSLDGLIPRKRSRRDAGFSVDFNLNETPPP